MLQQKSANLTKGLERTNETKPQTNRWMRVRSHEQDTRTRTRNRSLQCESYAHNLKVRRITRVERVVFVFALIVSIVEHLVAFSPCSRTPNALRFVLFQLARYHIWHGLDCILDFFGFQGHFLTSMRVFPLCSWNLDKLSMFVRQRRHVPRFLKLHGR